MRRNMIKYVMINVLFTEKKPLTKYQKFVRNQLKMATEDKYLPILKLMIQRYEALNPPSYDEVLLKARELLKHLEAREGKYITLRQS